MERSARPRLFEDEMVLSKAQDWKGDGSPPDEQEDGYDDLQAILDMISEGCPQCDIDDERFNIEAE